MSALVGGAHPLRVIRNPLTIDEINRLPDNKVITLPVGPAANVPVVEAVYWTGHFIWAEQGDMVPDVIQVKIGGLTPGARIRTAGNGSVTLDPTQVLEERQANGWMRVDHLIGEFPESAEWDLEKKQEYTAPIKTAEILAKLISEGCELNERAIKQQRIGSGLARILRPGRLDREEDFTRKQKAANNAKSQIKEFQAALAKAVKSSTKGATA